MSLHKLKNPGIFKNILGILCITLNFLREKTRDLEKNLGNFTQNHLVTLLSPLAFPVVRVGLPLMKFHVP